MRCPVGASPLVKHVPRASIHRLASLIRRMSCQKGYPCSRRLWSEATMEESQSLDHGFVRLSKKKSRDLKESCAPYCFRPVARPGAKVHTRADVWMCSRGEQRKPPPSPIWRKRRLVKRRRGNLCAGRQQDRQRLLVGYERSAASLECLVLVPHATRSGGKGAGSK
ncbi:hypothetical protein GQ53DRAFT_511995 [Thozetella sp. PMI_491]|nr:hypothetical protein GQ53DRAFT_511995 [Thozetella sp. PMI_491]